MAVHKTFEYLLLEVLIYIEYPEMRMTVVIQTVY